MQDLASIIIPCRNAAQTLAAAVNSCLAQTWPNIEVIIVDNGSTDASLALAQELAASAPDKVRVLQCPEPGANRARLAGYANARGSFIRWLDADDQMEETVTERQILALAADERFQIAYCDWVWRKHLDHPPNESELLRMPAMHTAVAYGARIWQCNADNPHIAEAHFKLAQFDDYLLRLLEDKWIPPHAYLLRRTAAQQLVDLQAFLPQRKVAQDREFFSMAAILGMRFLHVAGARVYYNAWSGSQMTRSISATERADQLDEIFSRLRALAEVHTMLRLKNEHWLLLNQPWQSYRLAAQPVSCRLEPLDEQILKVLQGVRHPATLEQLAKWIQHGVMALWEQHAAVIAILLRFCESGLLVVVPNQPGEVGAVKTRKRLLLVTDVPFWQNGRGDAARIRALVEFLAEHVALDLFIVQIRGDQAAKLSRISLTLGDKQHIAWLANAPHARQLPAMLAKATELAPCDVCLIEYLRLHELRQALPAGVTALLDTHDLVSERAASFRRFGAKPPNDLDAAAEFATFREFDGVVLIQAEEYASTVRELGPERCILAPHPVVMPRTAIRPRAKRIGLVASNYTPNLDGLNWFLNSVWNDFSDWDVQLHIFGRVGTGIDASRYKNLLVRGMVDDLAGIYQSCDIMINPVRFGAGLKIKTVEALASGLPLVTTTEGARGLGEHAGSAFLVADDANLFRNYLHALVGDATLRTSLSQAAWQLASTLFTPDACFQALLQRIRS